MRRFVLLVPLAIVVVSTTLASAAEAAPQVELQPAVAQLRERVTIAVSGIHARSLEVLLAGATERLGNQPASQLPWMPLHLVDGAWRGTLPAPALPGIYPVVLRTRAGAAPIRSGGCSCGSSRRAPAHSLHSPVPSTSFAGGCGLQHAKLVAIKAWPRPGFDLRDLRLHRLFVVAYSPSGHPQVRDRLGMFVTAVRDGYSGRWRLLEATLEP